MAKSIEVRYQTAVEGLQAIAGGDGDAADIAVQTLDKLRVQTERLNDAVALAEFGASDAACYLYPGEDQKAERAAFCRGAGYDHVRISALTRKLEEAKVALEFYGCRCAPGEPCESGNEDDVTCGRKANRTLAALASLSPEQPAKPEAVDDTRDLIANIEKHLKGRNVPATADELLCQAADTIETLMKGRADALPQDVVSLVIAAREFWDTHGDPSDESRALDAALMPFASHVPYEDEPAPEKPEAVETGEPVAWRYRQESSDEWQLTDLRSVMRRFKQAGFEVEPLYASPVSDGEARRKALDKCCHQTGLAHCEGCPHIPVARCKCFRCLAIPTAGDATNGQ